MLLTDELSSILRPECFALKCVCLRSSILINVQCVADFYMSTITTLALNGCNAGSVTSAKNAQCHQQSRADLHKRHLTRIIFTLC